MDKSKKCYFVKLNEFEEKNKETIIAIFLAYPFGLLGFHRFYLRRYLSGVILAFISLLSLIFGKGILAVFVIILTLIEALIYLYYTVRIIYKKSSNSFIKNDARLYKNHKDKKTLIRNEPAVKDEDQKLKPVIDNLNEQSMKVMHQEGEIIKIFGSDMYLNSYSDSDLELIDISEIKPSSVKFYKDFEFANKNWIEKLELPYERTVMKITQIKSQTLKMYEKLCFALDENLLKRSLSLNSEVRRINNQERYYNNLLYTIYCIAEGIVTESYSGRLYFDYWYSYNILKSHLGSSVSEFVLETAQSLSLDLPQANREIIDYFNLTSSGLSKVWWDEDGYLRGKFEFSNRDLNILKVTPPRSSIVWQYILVKEQIILLYLKLWNLILDSLKNELYWTEQKSQNINRLASGNLTYYELEPFQKMLSSLIKISENSVRAIIPNMRHLAIEKDELNLIAFFPEEVCVDIKSYLEKFKDNLQTETIKKIIVEITEAKPEDWRMKLELFLILGTEESIGYLVTLYNSDHFLNIAKNILKRTNTEEQRLLALSILAFEDQLSRNERQELKKLIHSQNWLEFEKLIQTSKAPSKLYFERVLALRKLQRKKIVIDKEKIEASKRELEETVSIVEQFIGEQDDDWDKQINESYEKNKKETKVENENLEYVQFIKLLLQKEKLPIDTVAKIALEQGSLLNAFISDINRELYEYVQDQTILVKDDYVVLDSFYIDLVKEIINSDISNQ